MEEKQPEQRHGGAMTCDPQDGCLSRSPGWWDEERSSPRDKEKQEQ